MTLVEILFEVTELNNLVPHRVRVRLESTEKKNRKALAFYCINACSCARCNAKMMY
jgi:hypothetical protein